MLSLLIRVRRARAVLRVALSGSTKRFGRVALSTFAVLLGVAFITGIQALADTVDKSAQDLLTASLKPSGVVVRSTSSQQSAGAIVRQTVPSELLDAVSDMDGVANAEGIVQGFGRLVGEDGTLIDPGIVPTVIFNWVADEQLAMAQITEGSPPETETEAVIDARTSSDTGWQLGDSIRIQGSNGVSTYEISGIGSLGSGDRSTGVRIVMMQTDEAQRFSGSDGQLSYLLVRAEDGVSPEDLVDELGPQLPLGTEAITGAEFLAETSLQAANSIDLATRFSQAFGLIGLVVAGLTIANSFSILMAQRNREMALLRVAGATRRQIAAGVLIEAFVVGLIGSAAGVLVGFGAAWAAIKAVTRIFTIDNPLPVLTPWTILWGLCLGTVTTMLAAAIPAWRSSRVPPIEALHDAAIEARPVSSARKWSGIALGVVGLVSTGLAWASAGMNQRLIVFSAGAMALVVSMVLVGPSLCPPVISVLGRALRPIQRNSRLAIGDAKRHAKRTTATAIAMAVGLAVATMVTMVASSLEGTATDTFKKRVSADLIIDGGLVNPLAGGIPEVVYERISHVEDVNAITRLRMVPAQVFTRDLSGVTGDQFVAGVDAPEILELIDLDVVAGTARGLETGGVAIDAQLAKSEGWELGDDVSVSFPQAGTLTFRVGLIYRTQIPLASVLLPMEAIDQVSSQALRQDTQIYLSLYDPDPDGPAVTEIKKIVADVSPASTVKPVDEWLESGVDQVNNAVGVIYALLAFAVLLSLFGIVNTLSLSMVERTNEIGLLRAVGLTRRQLLIQVVTEGALIAVFGALLGVGIGLWVGGGLISITKDTTAVSLDIPWLTLLGLVLGAGLAGLVAAVVPAIRAGRMNIAEAIS